MCAIFFLDSILIEFKNSRLRKPNFQDMSEKENFKARSSRPAWTYLIWGSGQDSRDEKSRLTFRRGKVYEEQSEYSQAIKEYLKAAKFEPREERFRRFIMQEIGKVLSLCSGETGTRNVTWQNIEQMSQSLPPNGVAPNWCNASETG